MTLMQSQKDYYRVVQAELGRSLRARWEPDEDLTVFEDLLQRLDQASDRRAAPDPNA